MSEVYAVYSENGEAITSGLQGPKVCDEAARTAQSIADSRGKSVWVGPVDAEWDDLIEVHPAKGAADCERAQTRPLAAPRTPGVPNANPKLQIRLEPWLHAWATEKGPEAVRKILEAAYWAEGME